MEFAGFILLGLLVGCFGTLIGAGGGFLLAHILVLLYPHEEPEVLASISLTVVFFNALSGSAGYVRQRLVDLRAGLVFSAAAIPGAILGAEVTTHLQRVSFELILGLMLVAGAGLLLLKPPPEPELAAAPGLLGPRIKHPLWLGALISFGVGIVAGLLGIGGGIIHVPAMVHLLGFPVHVAAATSHFVLALSAGAALATHAAHGSLVPAAARALPLAFGAIIGAQVGARLAKRIHARLILRALAVALALAGARILWSGITALR